MVHANTTEFGTDQAAFLRSSFTLAVSDHRHKSPTLCGELMFGCVHQCSPWKIPLWFFEALGHLTITSRSL